MVDPIQRPSSKPFTPEDYDKPVPTTKERAQSTDLDRAPWLSDPAFGSVVRYSEVMLANPALRASTPAAGIRQDWPALPAFPAPRATQSTSAGCAALVAAPGNAHTFADRGIPLGLALKDGAFGSSSDLGQFIDEYVAHTAARPDMKALHADAIRRGPEILAGRLDTEDGELQRRSEEQQMQDRIAPLQLRAPLPVQQRAAVGEVAIPIARATTFAVKFVPMAGQLVVLAEVATGHSIAGLGEKLSNADRALDAALLLAPHAAKALSAGVRGSAELLRLSRATGRSTAEVGVICRAAVAVQKNRAAVRGGLEAAQAGRALTSEQRAAMELVSGSVDGLPEARALRGRMYKPTVADDASLAAGQGWTDKYGNVGLSPHGTQADRALADAHEAVHSFLSPKAMNGLRELRADIGMNAYARSGLCRYLEEALAETYAQVKVNGVRALPDGLVFPIRNGYVSLGRVAGEGAIGTIAYGGVLYAVHVKLNQK